jgi:hypothetical protein
MIKRDNLKLGAGGSPFKAIETGLASRSMARDCRRARAVGRRLKILLGFCRQSCCIVTTTYGCSQSLNFLKMMPSMRREVGCK